MRYAMRRFTMKGIPTAEVEEVASTMITDLGLGQYADKMAGSYSGGNKRKLSVAVAMIGNPQIVFLVRIRSTIPTVTRCRCHRLG